MDTTTDLGRLGEELACNYLITNGYTILERNWRQGNKEVDIIATKGHSLHIIEVKLRSSSHILEPHLAVNKSKQKNLIYAANSYVLRKNITLNVVFDIISILLTSSEPTIDHMENAFYPY